MSEPIKNPQVEAQRQELIAAREKGKLATLKTFAKYSGPGWLQGATTLGGGTLASALYLGVLGGFGFMWLQPFAMVLGVIMLSAISYVTLSISTKPMQAINKGISPILGYGWAIGAMLACFVFIMPQFSLGVAAVEQNLAVDAFQNSQFLSDYGKYIVTGVLFAIGFSIVLLYARGGKGVKIVEYFVKISIAAVVICFFGVVIRLGFAGTIDWGKLGAGFIPRLSIFSEPSADFMAYINMLTEEGKSYWSSIIVDQQRNVIISAATIVVGINMTFMFPYSLLKKNWNKDFRPLAIFDLATGLFIPFSIVASCIVIASASEFHAKPAEGLNTSHWVIADNSNLRPDFVPVLALNEEKGAWAIIKTNENPSTVLAFAKKADTAEVKPAVNLAKQYFDILDKRIATLIGSDDFAKLTPEERVKQYNAIDKSEKVMASMLVKRDASNLADTLTPLVGEKFARYIFGLGVMGMAMNAVLMNMLICGVCFVEIIGKSGKPKWQVLGSSLLIVSACASLFWEGAKMWLVIHAGVMAAVLLPIAFGAFLVMMNSKKILGASLPRGKARFAWNTLMGISLTGSSIASLYVLNDKIGIAGPITFFGFALLVLVSWAMKHMKKA